MTDGDCPFWDFSLALHARPGVADACLALQDRRDLDVNLLLFCCWQANRGIALSDDDVSAVVAATRDWQSRVVVPLRGLRRHLGTLGRADADPLRQGIKENELEAERLEQALLLRQAEALKRGAAGGPDPKTAAANLGAYLRCLGVVADDRDRATLVVLLAAAFGGLAKPAARALLEQAL